MTRRRILIAIALALLGTGIAVAQQTGRLTLSDLEALIDDLMSENDAQQTRIDGLEADNAALQSANAALQARVDELERAHPCGGALCVFVTADTFGSDFGGPGGADDACRDAARTAGLPGRYEAWISDSTEEAVGRLLHTRVPYRRTDGALVAQDWADLTDGSIANPIDRTADGTQIVPGPGVEGRIWTGTVADGTTGAEHCSDWTSGGPGMGTYGNVTLSSSRWTDDGTSGCAGELRLYCFQQ